MTITNRTSFTTEEKQFIRERAPFETPKQIASQLENRSFKQVLHFIRKYSLDVAASPDKTSGEQIIQRLRNEPFYRDLSKQFSAPERTTFENQWASIVAEWGGDIMAREKPELREFLSYEILKSRTLMEEKRILTDRAVLERELREFMRREPDTLTSEEKAEIRNLRSSISSADKSISDSRSTYKNLCEKSDKTRRSLFDSRAQRTRAIEAAGSDFASLLKQLDDWNFRHAAAREMEFLKQSAQLERERLSELYEFSDGNLDPPILNSDTIID